MGAPRRYVEGGLQLHAGAREHVRARVRATCNARRARQAARRARANEAKRPHGACGFVFGRGWLRTATCLSSVFASRRESPVAHRDHASWRGKLMGPMFRPSRSGDANRARGLAQSGRLSESDCATVQLYAFLGFPAPIHVGVGMDPDFRLSRNGDGAAQRSSQNLEETATVGDRPQRTVSEAYQ